MREVLIGQTDYTVLVKIVGTDGAPESGLTEASIDLAYSRVETDNDVTTADVTPAALSALTDAHTDWGFEEVSSTDHPGLYRLDIADAVFASGAWEAVVTITDASGTDFYAVDIGFRLVAHDPADLGTKQSGDSFARLGAPAGASVSADIAAIEAQTDDIGAAGAGLTALATQASVNAVDDFLDTEIAAIKAVTDALTAAAAAKLALSAGQIITGTIDTTVAPSTTEFEADDITEATADHYNGRVVIFTSGVLAGQATSISDYALAGGKGHFTVVSMTEAPGNNDTFIIV
jgi:hypothetical protein